MRRMWNENLAIDYRIDMDSTFKIDENDFEKLVKLYKFQPYYKQLSFYDPKHKQVVARFVKNDKDFDIYFSKSWLKMEVERTSVKLLVDILKKYQELASLYHYYRKKKRYDNIILLCDMDLKIRTKNKSFIEEIRGTQYDTEEYYRKNSEK